MSESFSDSVLGAAPGHKRPVLPEDTNSHRGALSEGWVVHYSGEVILPEDLTEDRTSHLKLRLDKFDCLPFRKTSLTGI